MTKSITIILLYTVISLTVYGQSLSFSEKYNLNFRDVSSSEVCNWTNSIGTAMIAFLDTIEYNGKKPYLLKRVFLGEKPIFDVKGSLQQYLPIPANVHKGQIRLSAKTANMKTAELIVAGKNVKEELIYVDTISFNGTSDWRTLQYAADLENVSLLYIELRLKGNQNDEPHFVALDRVEITIDDKSIDEYSWDIIPDYPIVTTYKVPLSEEIGKTLSGKKIIALGESVHGSKTMNQYGIEVIKQFVSAGLGNLILLEIPLEWTLSINRYIARDTDFVQSDVFYQFRNLLFSYSDWMNLLEWLKVFNAKHEHKIYLAGMDHNDLTAKRNDLFDYFYLLNKKYRLPVLDSICSDLINEGEFSVAYNRLQNAELPAGMLNDTEKQLLMYCLDEKLQRIKDSKKYFVQRDSMMFQNSEYLMSVLKGVNGGAIVYAHFLHCNNLTCDPASIGGKSLGSLMRTKYGKTYTCIGLFGKTGSCLSLINGEYKIVNMLPFPVNSMEASLSKAAMPILHLSGLSSALTYVRCIGGFSFNTKRQFLLCNPSQYMDDVVFFDSCEAAIMDGATNKYPPGVEQIQRIKTNKEKLKKQFMIK